MKFKPFSQDSKQVLGAVRFGVEQGKGSECTMEKEHKVVTELSWGLGFPDAAPGEMHSFFSSR